MIKEYNSFVNESWFNKNFDERISQIDDNLFKFRKQAGLLVSKDSISIRNKYFNRIFRSLYEISEIFDNIITKYKYKLSQEQINILIKKWTLFEKYFTRITFNGNFGYVMTLFQSSLEHANSFIYQLTLLEEYDKIINYKTTYGDDDLNIDRYVIAKVGEWYKIVKVSEKEEKERKQREAHKDIDPYGEEKWEDANENKDYEEEDDWEEENEMDDPEIHVGDRVIVNYYSYNMRLINEMGEVIRIFDCSHKFSNVHTRQIVVKFDNRRDLFSSKLSQHKDCYSFLVKFNPNKNIYIDYAGLEIIRKIN